MMQASDDRPVDSGFDHHSPAVAANPHAIFDEMRTKCPVAYSSQYDGFWSFLNYQSVFTASCDDDLFNSYPTVGIPGHGLPYPLLPIESDPPATKPLRDISIKQFSLRSAERLRPHARRMATAMVDEFIERGECDIISELATPLPARVILHRLGFDESRYLQWVDWVHTLVHDRTHDENAAAVAGMELFAELNKHLEERRATGLGDDPFDNILRGEVDGEPLTDIEIVMYTFLVIFGGMDTTSGPTGNTLEQLMLHPEFRQALIEHPEILRPATEEFLRHSSPTLGLARTVSRDAEFCGQQLKVGDRAILMWAAANHDPAVFTNPHQVDLTRDARRHLAFGVGIHRCLGAHIARMMFQEMISEILERLPDFEFNATPDRFGDAGDVYAVRHMPITFTPGPRLPAG